MNSSLPFRRKPLADSVPKSALKCNKGKYDEIKRERPNKEILPPHRAEPICTSSVQFSMRTNAFPLPACPSIHSSRFVNITLLGSVLDGDQLR